MLTGWHKQAILLTSSYAILLLAGWFVVSAKSWFVTQIETPTQVAGNLNVMVADPEIPLQLKIDSLGIDLNIKTGSYNSQSDTWDLDQEHAFFAEPTSALNAGRGVSLIYGHNRSAIFSRLHQLQVGDEVVITSDDGTVRRYSFTSSNQVEPTDVSILNYSGPHKLVLQTCTGNWSEYRVLFDFKLIETERPNTEAEVAVL